MFPGLVTARGAAAAALLAAVSGCRGVPIPDGPGPARSLPLREYPVAAPGRTFAVLLSGDAPLLGLPGRLAGSLQEAGIPVVLWHSTSYYWTPRTPGEAARDLDLLVRHFAARWERPRVVVVGYSMGADNAPFLVNRLPPESRARIHAVAMLAAARGAVFRFHVEQWWRDPDGPHLPVRPEVERLRGTPVLCVHGAGDENAACAEMHAAGARLLVLDGGHRFRGDYGRLARAVVELARSAD